jgi:cytoskeletal protein RodZ
LLRYIGGLPLTLDSATTWDVDMRYHTKHKKKDLPLTGIGAQIRRQRLGLRLAMEDISRETKIPSHHLEAIERDDFASLPSLLFTRNFVRQFALFLKLDPEPLLAQLPRQDEAPVKLPDPPARRRSAYHRDRQIRSALTAAAWVLVAGGAGAAWFHLNHSTNTTAPKLAPTEESQVAQIAQEPAKPAVLHQVQVVITAHQSAWVEMSADGKAAFTGVLKADEMKEIAADEQVKLVAGNAGALTILLNGKTLEPLGPVGEVRVVRLTAEGPQFLARSRQTVPDPL